MKHSQILLNEYQKHETSPIYCHIGTQKLIVPYSYNGEIDRFVDDIFAYEKEAVKYNKYNKNRKPEEPEFDVKMLKNGKISFLPPFDLYAKGISQQDIVKKSINRALRRYSSTLRKIKRAQKEYPAQTFTTAMDTEYISHLDSLHEKYIFNQFKHKLIKFSRFTIKETANMTAGALGALPMAAYYLLDKKIHFPENRTHSFLKKTVFPYIRKGLVKDIVLAIPLSLSLVKRHTTNAGQENSHNISYQMNSAPSENGVENSIFNKKFAITDKASFDKFFDMAMPYIAESMMPTEILVLAPYSDNGKKVNNTLGLGSYYMPKDGNPQNPDWEKTSRVVKDLNIKGISGKDAYELAKGWFKNRDGGRICRLLFNKLEGTELTIGEFTAICTCMYNDENNGKKFCEFVAENYQNPIKCATYLMDLKPGNSKFNDGILKRHAHEALTYLNLNNYCDKVPYFMVKEGINSKGNKYFVTSVTQLTPEICHEMREGLREGKLDGAQKVAKSVYSYHCKGGKAVYQICNSNDLGFLVNKEQPLDFGEMAHVSRADSIYKKALESYQEQDYPAALAEFRKMVEEGYNSADIHNDMAITYYNMGKYQECIDECRQILKTGETEQYAPANFNAGKAYEALGKPDKALENYNLSLQREPNNKYYQSAVTRLSRQMNGKTQSRLQKSR